MAMYELNDRVMLVYRDYDLATDELKGLVKIAGTVTRVWPDQKTITIKTDDGKTFFRYHNSPYVWHLV